MSSDAQIQNNKKPKPLSKPEVLFSKLPSAFNAGTSSEMTERMIHSFMLFAETETFVSPLTKDADKEQERTRAPRSFQLSSPK